MKTIRLPFRGIGILLISLFLFSCQKQLQEPEAASVAAEEMAAAAAGEDVGCKAEVLGVVVDMPDGSRHWRTLMQKWFGGDGKLAYLKANLGTDFKTYQNFLVMIEWGEVTYHNNTQVMLRDVLRDQQVMRVTLDGAGKPTASYFRYSAGPGQPAIIDTSYYYYVGDRLDEIISLSRIPPATGTTFRKFKFMYDMHGNLTRAQSGDTAGSGRMNFYYDYSKPVADMMPPHFVNFPHALLEYMDLFHFPIHHQITQVVLGQYVPGSSAMDQTVPLETWDYNTYVLESNGLVYSHMDTSDPAKKAFYTGWNCSPMPGGRISGPSGNELNTLTDFQQKFPQPVK
jgi:hypothetical protein